MALDKIVFDRWNTPDSIEEMVRKDDLMWCEEYLRLYRMFNTEKDYINIMIILLGKAIKDDRSCIFSAVCKVNYKSNMLSGKMKGIISDIIRETPKNIINSIAYCLSNNIRGHHCKSEWREDIITQLLESYDILTMNKDLAPLKDAIDFIRLGDMNDYE